jgi:hypothetical protein
MELITPKQKKERRFQQVVWVRQKVMAWLMELSEEYGMAVNSVISELLDRLYEKAKGGSFNLMQKPQPQKVEKVTVVVCPYCYEEFPDMTRFREHRCAKGGGSR